MKLIQVFERLSIKSTISIWIAAVIIFSALFYATSTPTITQSVYLSFITATTIGYEGAISGFGKALAIIEAIVSLVLFGIFIAKLVAVKQEHVLTEIRQLSLEDATNNLVRELYLFRNQLKDVKTGKDAKEFEQAIQELNYSLTTFNNAANQTNESQEKSLMRISLLANALTHSLSKLVELLETFKGKQWKKESIAATLNACEQVTAKIVGHYAALNTYALVAEKLEDLNKTLATLQKSIQAS